MSSKKTLKDFPDILKEWDYELNGDVVPDDLSAFCNKPFYWKCFNGHPSYLRSVSKKTTRKTGCPVCSNKKVLPGVNDLATVCQELMKEWDWENNENEGLDPTTLRPGSHFKAHWICQRGHRWSAVISSRALLHTGCRECAKELKTSYPEKAIAYYMSLLFNDSHENYRSKELNNSELDVYIPSLKLGIEYDGLRWHKDSIKDIKKDELCDSQGIYLIRVREIGCVDYQSNSPKIYIKSRGKGELKKAIETVVDLINEKYGISLERDIDPERDGPTILANVLSLKKENSIINSSFIDEWDYEKNKDINPEYISIDSNNGDYWWKCRVCEYEWQAAPATRHRGAGCPHCSGRVPKPGVDDLLTLYPKLCEEWDYSKNTILPSEVLPGSGEKVWWICPICKHGYRTEVRVRALQKCGCKKCGHVRTGIASHKQVRNVETGIVYESVAIAADTLGISRTSITNCLTGRSKTAGGYHWEYANKK